MAGATSKCKMAVAVQPALRTSPIPIPATSSPMQLLDLTLETAAENVALDEALLEGLENQTLGEVVRVWEPTRPMVVIGRSTEIEREVRREECRRRDISVIRRATGGLSITTGPGCLMYAVTLDLDERPDLRSVDAAHCFVLQRILRAIRSFGVDASCQGSSDLTLGKQKFSGNSLRYRRRSLLYHGTLLNRFSIPLIEQTLGDPRRQPDYREQRSHEDFVTNLNLDPTELKAAVLAEWPVTGTLDPWPVESMRRFVAEQFSLDSWNARR